MPSASAKAKTKFQSVHKFFLDLILWPIDRADATNDAISLRHKVFQTGDHRAVGGHLELIGGDSMTALDAMLPATDCSAFGAATVPARGRAAALRADKAAECTDINHCVPPRLRGGGETRTNWIFHP